MRQETSPQTSWSRRGTAFAGNVHVDPKVTDWLSDQEPGASLYRWGLLLGIPPDEHSPDISVNDVTPLQNRAQLDAAVAAWTSRPRRTITAVGLCGWGNKNTQKDVLQLFEQVFPASGRVLIFAKPGARRGQPEMEVYIQDGLQAGLHNTTNSTRKRVLTWSVAVLAVLIGVPLLMTLAHSDSTHPPPEPAATQRPLVEQPAAQSPTLPAEEKAAAADTNASATQNAKKNTSPAKRRRRADARPIAASNSVDEGSHDTRASSGRKWTRPFTWLRDSTWRPIADFKSRRSH